MNSNENPENNKNKLLIAHSWVLYSQFFKQICNVKSAENFSIPLFEELEKLLKDQFNLNVPQILENSNYNYFTDVKTAGDYSVKVKMKFIDWIVDGGFE